MNFSPHFYLTSYAVGFRLFQQIMLMLFRKLFHNPEVEILYLLAEGLSNREIAQKLVITPETVKWYNEQIYNN